MPAILLKLFGLPRWAKIAAAVALLVLALPILKGCYDRSVIREHEREVAEQVREKTEAGEKAGRDAAVATKSEVEKRNDEARKAAAGSDDPLKSGIDSLRNPAGPHRNASR